jgi:glycosyltransferase involved in cell wall biosynthesis
VTRLLSVFTPSHDTRYLTEAYESLAAQTHREWEWVVLLNGRARSWMPPREDPRVLVVPAPPGTKGVGALKRAAVERSKGDVLVELDHDDVLLPTCLEQVSRAFDEHPEASLVYSDFAQVEPDGTPNHDRFNPDSGWVYTPEGHDGVVYDRCHAMAPTPHNMGYIWFEPNHVRAFRRDAYEAAGGYDPEHAILDDQELMLRLYALGEFHHIDQLLYLQRVHRANTQSDPTTNATIQSKTVELYQQHIQSLALAWTQRAGLRAIRLIPQSWYGPPHEEGFEDVRLDVFDPVLDLPDDSCGVVLATDVLQKLLYRATLLNEVYRVLPHAGMLLTLTPSTDGRGAFQDPAAVAYYNENSFMYLTQEVLRPTIPDLVSRFQVSHLRTFFPTDTHREMQIPYVQANLIAVKGDGPRQGGPLLT